MKALIDRTGFVSRAMGFQQGIGGSDEPDFRIERDPPDGDQAELGRIRLS